MSRAGTSASDVTRFSGEVQDFLTASAIFSRRPGGLKKMPVKIIFKDQILFCIFQGRP